MPREITNIWGQIPFCGSLILRIPPLSKVDFENAIKISEIQNVINFVKETGKLQVTINTSPTLYEGLDYLDPIFKELKPPLSAPLPISILASSQEVNNVRETFYTLAEINYFPFLKRVSEEHGSQMYLPLVNSSLKTYETLKLVGYVIANDLENLMVDEPKDAFLLVGASQHFIVDPFRELRCDLRNFTLWETRQSQRLPSIYQSELRFPCEIGKFLLRKLTYAAQDMRRCYYLMDNYAAYDLQKVQESLNDAIVKNHPEIVSKSAEEFSEILDNVWNDPLIPRQTKNIIKGIPISIAAIGTAVSAYTGDLKGFLAGLGFSVGAEFLKAEIEGLSERIAKFFARSYQANVYDFKKKYKDRIVHTPRKEQDWESLSS